MGYQNCKLVEQLVNEMQLAPTTANIKTIADAMRYKTLNPIYAKEERSLLSKIKLYKLIHDECDMQFYEYIASILAYWDRIRDDISKLRID